MAASQYIAVEQNGTMVNMYMEASLANFGNYDYSRKISGSLLVLNYTRGC